MVDRDFRDEVEQHHLSDNDFRAIYQFFQSRFGKTIAKIAGVDISAVEELSTLLDETSDAALLVAPLGWPMVELRPTGFYGTAAEAVKSGDIGRAEQVLVEGWNNTDIFGVGIKRVLTLHGGDLPKMALLQKRYHLLSKALSHHRDGNYEASVPIVLSQIDGLLRDVLHIDFYNSKSLQHRTIKELELSPEMRRSLAGLHGVLCKNVSSTQLNGVLSRHGILHGRELGYDTEVNSTKALVALLAVIEWLQPVSNQLADKRYEEKLAKYLGSDELDETGRRLDRAGFPEAKLALDTLSQLQLRYIERYGKFAADLAELEAKGWLLNSRFQQARPVIRATADRLEYWSWVRTPGGYVLGTSRRANDQGVFRFGDKVIPSNGPSAETGQWFHSMRGRGHREW